MFQLFGTQDWGIQNFNDQYLAGSGTQTYEIAIGQFYTGSFDRLVFAMDDDAGVGGNSVFSNIEIFEGIPPVLQINGESSPISSYGGSQNQGFAEVSEDDARVVLSDNTWQDVLRDVVITEDTVLRFEFRSDVEGEIHAIGFDTDDDLSEEFMFQLSGTQEWGLQYYSDQYATGTGIQSFEIAVGQFYTGNFDRLVFAMDDDADLGGDSVFSNIEIFEAEPRVVLINGEDSVITAYGGPQNQGMASVSADGATVTLSDNAWQDVMADVVITEDTVLRFDFSSDVEGEIHAIGFDNDNDLSEGFMFQLSGTQGWGLQDFSDQYVTGSGTQSFEIAVGQFYTGTFDRLVFAMDDDAGLGGDSVFTNIEIVEVPRPGLVFDGIARNVSTYGGTQDKGTAVVSDNGASVTLANNAWKDMPADVVITEDTVLRFDFSSDVEGEIHGIGFDNDNELSDEFMFQLSGTQGWGIQDFNNQYVTGRGIQSYEIAIGEFYTGTFDRFVFAMDDDAGLGGTSTFSNIEFA